MRDQAFGDALSRKSLLKAGAAGVALALGARPVMNAAMGEVSVLEREDGPVAFGRPLGPAPDSLRLDTYLPHVGSTFGIERPGRPALPVRLVAATPLELRVQGEAPTTSDGSSFSLLFRARGKAVLPAGIHVLVHRQLGAFPLGLSPVGRAVAGQGFQVIVNRSSI